MSEKQYCVYIMTNVYNTVLYTGVTNNLERRVLEHREGKSNFTKKYNVTKLVYYECGGDVNVAIAREKQIKGGSRQKKLDLVNGMNPQWKDLYEEFFGDSVTASRPFPKGIGTMWRSSLLSRGRLLRAKTKCALAMTGSAALWRSSILCRVGRLLRRKEQGRSSQ